jgi:metal-responsive CopG/Arc/MetJ family transcriptional regulator
MPRIQISIKLDEDLLARVDRVAEETGYSRTAIIEQAVKADLPEREAFQRSLENPVLRVIHKRLTTPAVMRAIAVLANEEMTDEDIADILEHAPTRRESGKRRQEEKRTKRSANKEDS